MVKISEQVLRHWPNPSRARLPALQSFTFYRGRGWNPLLPPNRTGGFPASGSPVGEWLPHRIEFTDLGQAGLGPHIYLGLLPLRLAATQLPPAAISFLSADGI
jgi:hypothetical protein